MIKQNNNFDSKYVRLSDYKPYEYKIPKVNLNFIIEEKNVKVISEFFLIRNGNKSGDIRLKGIDIEIIKIFQNGALIDKSSYQIKPDELIIKPIPKEVINLKIEGYIKPKRNTFLLGLYESNKIITSQCEAEGFRRICFHPDRPDVLSKFLVTIKANKENYPILLSNGNLIEKKILEDNIQEVIWEDPFPKPSYLFALVAGKLSCIKDHYHTKSNKRIEINIYVEEGDERYVVHALNSLKKAMKWDEEKYNLEYDLNQYNIVAIRHFNMGAMENKGLNIFNSKLILANSETATDSELEKIEAVVAHEYFHNWTGNRITCRDWFQLSLKEGLTVFRDQEFTSDMHNYEIKRIEDAKFLRTTQFKEDAGPTSHAVRPNKYLEIDNFYTTTIYEKGSEIIRMLKTIINEVEFKKKFKEYISKYDGKAATIDEFVDCILKDNNKGVEIEKFKLWYKQNGTPELVINRKWEESIKTLTINIKQQNKSKRSPINDLPLTIPIKIAIFTDIKKYSEFTFILKNKKDKIVLRDINTKIKKPIISCFREFSAPVKWETDLNFEEELFLLENESDLFTIYDSITRLYKTIIKKRFYNQSTLGIEDKFLTSIKTMLDERKQVNLSLLAEILTIPSLLDLEADIKPIEPLKLIKIINELNKKVSKFLKNELYNKLEEIEPELTKIWPHGKDERKLTEVIWKLILFNGDKKIKNKILSYICKPNMTLSKSALNVFQNVDCIERDKVSEQFFKKWENNMIVLDNWFYFSASINNKNFIQKLEGLFSHRLFDKKSPNTLRSILNGFVFNNKYFHSQDGQGYDYIAKKIIEFDKINPIVISRFIKIFSNWNLYDEPYKKNMLKAIRYIDSHKLSTNTREVIDLILNR